MEKSQKARLLITNHLPIGIAARFIISTSGDYQSVRRSIGVLLVTVSNVVKYIEHIGLHLIVLEYIPIPR